MPNCKPGDLAVIISSRVPSNIGLFVEVVDPHPRLLGWWKVRVSREGVTTRGTIIAAGNIGSCKDTDLKPIRGTSTPTKQTLDTPIPATVL